MDDMQRFERGQREASDAPFLAFVAVVFVSLIALGYVLFPTLDPASSIGPGSSATPKTGGGGPSAPTITSPASPGGNTAR